MAEPVVRVVVRRNTYADSISLLQVTAAVANHAGVLDAALVMATDLNVGLLRESGLLESETFEAGPNDLVIAIRATNETAASAALAAAEGALTQRRSVSSAAPQPPKSLRSAHRLLPDANLAVVSVPGPYAAAEAHQALAEGLDVFLFSDNVSIDDEVALKENAFKQGLLVMGPDCGTAIVNGVGLGFANRVRRGRIGLIGASGTGLQEITCLLHRAGEGISHAIGTGGRDLHSRVGGITTMQALSMLKDDPQTERVVLVSKPPAPEVAERVLRAAAQMGKPVIACFLGDGASTPHDGVQRATNLYQAARLAARPGATWDGIAADSLPRLRLRGEQHQVRGLYCGGTLCEEAETAVNGDGHQFIDFGDDQYTRGRAHPMIDPTLRNQAILEAAADPRVALVLLDVILGYGAHADPAGAVAPTVRAAIARADADGRQLVVLAHVVGSDLDPQTLELQEQILRVAGVQVFGSNHHAAVAASLLVERARV